MLLHKPAANKVASSEPKAVNRTAQRAAGVVDDAVDDDDEDKDEDNDDDADADALLLVPSNESSLSMTRRRSTH